MSLPSIAGRNDRVFQTPRFLTIAIQQRIQVSFALRFFVLNRSFSSLVAGLRN
jgi:hypothetical protein